MDLRNLNSARNNLSDNVINIALSFSELNYKTFTLKRRNIICYAISSTKLAFYQE